MHYKNGREAKNGDKVVVFPSYGTPYAGILYDAVAGNDACNGRVAVTSVNDAYPNLKECLYADDARGIIEAAFNPKPNPCTESPASSSSPSSPSPESAPPLPTPPPAT